MFNSIDIMINNIDIPSFVRLTTAILYVSGAYIVVSSIISMKDANLLGGDGPSMFDLIKKILIGCSLIYFPSVINSITATLFSETMQLSPLSYVDDTTDIYKPIYILLIQCCLLIGVIAVGRGLYILGYGKVDQEGNLPVYKAIVLIASGACLVNLESFIGLVLTTLGIN
jgi:hypothetical protein